MEFTIQTLVVIAMLLIVILVIVAFFFLMGGDVSSIFKTFVEWVKGILGGFGPARP